MYIIVNRKMDTTALSVDSFLTPVTNCVTGYVGRGGGYGLRLVSLVGSPIHIDQSDSPKSF